MDPGVLIYIAFFIIVAIIQGAGQKKKEAQKRSQKPPPDAGTGREAGTTTLPQPRSQGQSGTRTREAGKSSEGMVPEDVWAEILGMAKGETPTKEPPPPREETVPREEDEIEIYSPPGSIEEIPSFEARSLEDLEPRKIPDRSRGRELPEMEGPASAAVEAALAGETPEGLGRPITEGRRKPRIRRRNTPSANVFGDGSVEELRKAIVLREVLGPPVSLRDEDG